MPLSEEELRMLEQMERALLAEDPKFASALRGSRARAHNRRRVALGIVGFVVGVVLLMTGAVVSFAVVGIVGFVIMLGSAVFGLTSLRSRGDAPPAEPESSGIEGLTLIDGGRRPKASSSSGPSFIERMEERWRRRRDGGSGY